MLLSLPGLEECRKKKAHHIGSCLSSTDIIVSLLHSSNTSDKVTITEKPNGCYFGFSDELFLFVTSLDQENNLETERNC